MIVRGTLLGGVVLALLILCPAPTPACSLCNLGGGQVPLTLRQEAALPSARVILHGTIANPRTSTDGKGRTDLLIKTPLRNEAAFKSVKTLVLPRYLPIDNPKDPPHYLLFCDVDRGQLDPYRGVPLKGGVRTVEYVKKALSLDAKKIADNLAFYFRHLDDGDPEVSADAFLEFAKASDADILRSASNLSREKLRAWLEDPKTQRQRLSVYALLLGACGKAADADYLRKLLDSRVERYNAAADGILAGYIQLEPRKGWDLAHSILADGRKPLLVRLGVLRTLRFYHLAQPKESRPQVLKAMRTLLSQGELADLAVEDLRRWEIWDLTTEVLAVYGKKGYDAPLIKRAIIRYALCCKPTRETKDFLTRRRADEGDVVKEVEEFLKLEKGN
jgi:hypothetical protein